MEPRVSLNFPAYKKKLNNCGELIYMLHHKPLVILAKLQELYLPQSKETRNGWAKSSDFIMVF
jgi:hypothetical protein